MSANLTSALLSQLSALITERLGLHFPEVRWHDLERGITAAAAAFGFSNAYTYGQWLLSSPLTRNQVEGLAAHLTVGETYFFREKPAFAALQEHILPKLIHARRSTTRQLRVWSAACCTGEEAYSSAILLNQLIPDWKEWRLTILATDINPHFLQKAAMGHYGEWSFRNVPAEIKQRYFTQRARGRFEINPWIKQQVTFAPLNLVDDLYPSPLNNTQAMDVIFCRNVLMYFSPEQARKVVRKLYDSLAEGGWLIPSLGEASQALFSEFKTVQFENAILYQKESRLKARHIVDDYSVYSVASLQPSHTDSLPFRLTPPTLAEPNPWSQNNEPAGHPVPPSRAWVEAERGIKTAEHPHNDLSTQVEPIEDANDSETSMALARLYANQGKLDEALDWCKRCIVADRLNLSAYYLYATIQQERGEIADATSSLKRVLYIHPEFVMAHFSLGYLARRQGKISEAQKYFVNVLRLLAVYPEEAILPESDGMTASQLMGMVRSVSP